jgi:hypothetical protein
MWPSVGIVLLRRGVGRPLLAMALDLLVLVLAQGRM